MSPYDGLASDQGPFISMISAIPIYTEEYELAKAEGGIQELFKRFDAANITRQVDINRTNVAAG